MGTTGEGPGNGSGGGPADDAQQPWGSPDDATGRPEQAHLADLDRRIAAFRETVDALPALRVELAGLDRELSAARDRLRAAQTAAEQTLVAAGSATLPGGRAWLNLLTGRYGERRDAARQAREQAFAAADACQQDVERLAARAGRTRSAVQTAVNAGPLLDDLLEARTLARFDAADDPRAAQVRALEAEAADLAGRLREVDEAVEAVTASRAAVDETLRRLSSAHAWGTYDTFFGGGLLSSAVKHDRIDAANDAAAGISRSLERARAELADVRVDLRGTHLDLDPVSRGLDIWFDNIFSDWAVQSRIKDQQAAVSRIGNGLVEVLDRLAAIRADLERRRSEVVGGRRALLTGS